MDAEFYIKMFLFIWALWRCGGGGGGQPIQLGSFTSDLIPLFPAWKEASPFHMPSIPGARILKPPGHPHCFIYLPNADQKRLTRQRLRCK